MKYRTDFVTNSSSSSFICDVCGTHIEGYDYSLSDAEMLECESGHTFCEHHIRIPTIEETYEYVKKNFDENQLVSLKKLTLFDKTIKPYEVEPNFASSVCEVIKKTTDWPYDIPEMYCPICKLEHIDNYDKFHYLCKKLGFNMSEIIQEIKDKFETLDDLMDFLTEEEE